MLGLVVAAVLQKPVALPARAMRLDELLRLASSASGETLKAPGLGNRIVFVGGPARPSAVLRDDLAKVVYGKWRRVTDSWVLDEDPAAVALRDRARLASRIAQVKAQQAQMAAEAAPAFDSAAAKALLTALNAYDEAEKKDRASSWPFREKVVKLVPANLALRRIVASLDPTELARMGGTRCVWSDRPTRLQRPISNAATAAIRRLERDQTVWNQSYGDNTVWKEAHRNGWSSMDPRGYIETIPPGSLRLVLKAQDSGGDEILFSGNFVDTEGRMRQFGEARLQIRDGGGRDDPSPAVDPKEPKLVLSPEANAFSQSRTGREAPGAILRPLLLHPERRDPLDILVGEGLRGVAKVRRESIVACLGDDLINFYVGQGESAGEWLRDLYQMDYEVAQTGGAVVIRPRANVENVDRTRLGTLLRTGDANGYVPLDDLAEYAAATAPSDRKRDDALANAAFAILQPGMMEAARLDWKLLALWGSFTRSQRQVFMKPGNVRWIDVPKPLQDRLAMAVLNAESHEIMWETRRPTFTALDQEPTELLAKGFAFGDGVYGSGSRTEGVYVRSTDENPYNGGLATPWTLAYAVVNRERKPDETRYDGMPKVLPDTFLPGRIVSYGLRIELSPGLVWRKSGTYGEMDLRTKPIPLESLPESFRTSYEKALEGARKQPGG